MRKDGVAGHPIVGTWVVAVGLGPRIETVMHAYHGDGTAAVAAPDHAALGTWQPTGARTADLVFMRLLLTDDGAFAGFRITRGGAEVAEDGGTFTGTATVESPTPDGRTTGQRGPIRLKGSRLVAKPMGEPVGPVPGSTE